ncbi:hypothetical protein LHYA1_G009088 [Lachnellula hyalina]|uniref:Uncharacterized protein n=1 Tax=Lachnellula hyalina TaxID=1316788 RepID=A0A8H8QUY1_9HELO|nr:uncharacterized protein LHYA1_G009088 [Lachnellula hyalina]TVY22155.1 hypothetical protein LHYA1_G009088 [Lachnellula hyalina]
MSKCTLRPRADICHLCDFVISRQSLSRRPIRTQKSLNTVRATFPSSRRAYSQTVQQPQGRPEITSRKTTQILDAARKAVDGHTTKADLDKAFEEVRLTVDSLLSLDRIPSEQKALQALEQCDILANTLVETVSLDKKYRAASALLSLDDTALKSGRSLKLPPATKSIQNDLSNLAFSIITHPPVFITPKILALYVRVQATLKRPETFPQAFNLYANKPVPEEGSSPIRYLSQNPNKVANAIPQNVADLALQTAIEAKQLVVAMDIVEFSYATKAFRRAKFVRKGLLPATGVAIFPLAAYTLASQIALMQTTMETTMATNVVFAGLLAYVGFTGTIGIVAVTTANDQMDRVTWTPGLPLNQRWIREEERAAIDRIAGAWGFREVWQRGEEEGEEWEALREWIGLKGMILDRTSLMEGME